MALTHRNRWVRLSATLYGWIVRAYPREFREEFGAQMLESFTDRAHMSFKQRGVWGLVAVFLTALLESPARLYTEHTEPKNPRSVIMSEIEAGKKVWYRQEIWKQNSNFEAFLAGVSVCAQLGVALWFMHLSPNEPEFYFWFSVTMLALIPVQLISFYKRYSLKEKTAHA